MTTEKQQQIKSAFRKVSDNLTESQSFGTSSEDWFEEGYEAGLAASVGLDKLSDAALIDELKKRLYDRQ